MRSGPEIVRQLGYILLAFVQDSVFVLSAYQSVMSLFGFWQRRKPQQVVLLPADPKETKINSVTL